MSSSPADSPIHFRFQAPLVAVLLALLAPASRCAEDTTVHVVRGEYQRVHFDADIQRTAVGASDVAGLTELDSREILVLGKDYGRTSILVWLAGGEVRGMTVSVERDISVLQRALQAIDPGITAEMAPDRDAIVLHGIVPSISYKIAAEDAARRYLAAGVHQRGSAQGGGSVLVGAGGQAEPGAAPEAAGAPEAAAPQPLVEAPPTATANTAVINLIRLAELPARPENKIADALESLGLSDVRVERVLAGDTPDAEHDVFVLDGRVPDQTALMRAVTLAARIVGGPGGDDDVQVIADESGAKPVTSAGSAGLAGGALGGTSNDIGFGIATTSQSLRNRIESNIGRAMILEAASGRVLSFLQVTDLPQVRVDIRLLEVNRTRLQSYSNDFAALTSDFTMGALNAPGVATAVQGAAAQGAGNGSGTTDVQNVLGFLSGNLTDQFQLTSSRLAIDTTITLLETEGIARSLSQPSIAVLSGELAVVKVGGEIPVENTFTPAFGGTVGAGTFTTVVQQEFGVSLSVRPLVAADGSVTMDVIPEVTRPDFALTEAVQQSTGTSLPTVAQKQRSLRTTARLLDGQTMLVGGLISRDEDEKSSDTPWLSDIPGLGALFQGFSTIGDDTELVIVVHPVVVRTPSWRTGMWAFPTAGELLDEIVPPPPPPEADEDSDEHADQHAGVAAPAADDRAAELPLDQGHSTP